MRGGSQVPWATTFRCTPPKDNAPEAAEGESDFCCRCWVCSGICPPQFARTHVVRSLCANALRGARAVGSPTRRAQVPPLHRVGAASSPCSSARRPSQTAPSRTLIGWSPERGAGWRGDEAAPRRWPRSRGLRRGRPAMTPSEGDTRVHSLTTEPETRP